jgi:hypothetical protein
MFGRLNGHAITINERSTLFFAGAKLALPCVLETLSPRRALSAVLGMLSSFLVLRNRIVITRHWEELRVRNPRQRTNEIRQKRFRHRENALPLDAISFHHGKRFARLQIEISLSLVYPPSLGLQSDISMSSS